MMLCSAPAKAAANDGGGTCGPDPLIIEERRKAAEQNPKRPPWYMMNIAHPVMGWLYNQYLAKLGEVSPPGDACRTRFELSLLHPAVLKKLAEHYKIQ